MRTLLSALLTVIAMAAIVIAVPSMWTQQRLVDEDGFVEMIAPMGKDKQVQRFMAEEIAEQVSSRVNVPGSAVVAEKVATGYTQSPQFPTDFADLVRQQHAWLFDEPGANASQTMQFNITPMINRALATTNFGMTINEQVYVPLSESGAGWTAGRFHRFGEQMTTLAYAAVIIGVIAAVLALLVARRRGTVLAWLGIGTLLAAAASWAVAAAVSKFAEREVGGAGGSGAGGSGRAIAQLAIDTANADLTHVALITAIVGAGIVAVGVVVRVVFAGRG